MNSFVQNQYLVITSNKIRYETVANHRDNDNNAPTKSSWVKYLSVHIRLVELLLLENQKNTPDNYLQSYNVDEQFGIRAVTLTTWSRNSRMRSLQTDSFRVNDSLDGIRSFWS